MKKKNIESNIQSLTSEKDELLFLINDLRSKGIENNKRKYKKISRRLMDLNNTVDNEIRIVSLHDNQRKNLKDLKNELLVMNGLLNEHQNPNYYQNTQLSNQSQQNYNQERIEDNRLNEENPQVIEVPDNGASGKSGGNGNALRTLGWAAAGIGLGVLIYKGFKKLFGKEDERDVKDEMSGDKDHKQNKKLDNQDKDDKKIGREGDEINEVYDESNVKKYKDMVDYLDKRYKDDEGYIEDKNFWSIHAVNLEKDYHSSQIVLGGAGKNKEGFKNYNLNYFCKGSSNGFYILDDDGKFKKISNIMLKEILDEFDRFIDKYK